MPLAARWLPRYRDHGGYTRRTGPHAD